MTLAITDCINIYNIFIYYLDLFNISIRTINIITRFMIFVFIQILFLYWIITQQSLFLIILLFMVYTIVNVSCLFLKWWEKKFDLIWVDWITGWPHELCFQLIPYIAALSWVITITPLLAVLLLTASKDLVDDIVRSFNYPFVFML